MSIFNSNFFHNILNVGGVVIGGITTVALATGCTTDVSGGLECTHSFIPPQYAAPILLGIGAIKFVMNTVRDGLKGLVKAQPPVADAITTVVTPITVAPGQKAKVVAEVKATAEKKS